MNSFDENINKYYPYLWVILFFISYLIFYPENWMITDAYNYVNRGIAFSEGQSNWVITDFLTEESINLIPAPYNTGTSFFFAIFMTLLSKKALFLVPLFQVVLSVYLLSVTIKKNNQSQSALALLGLSLALMFFSRSAMSCMPSFLLISITCYLFFRSEIHWKSAFGLGFLAAFGFWFRESNVFLIAPFVLYCLYENVKLLPSILLGFILGLGPKIIADLLVYDTWWFSSASSGFSIYSIIDHLPEYGIILIVLIPLSILFIGLYKGKGDRTIKVGSLAFILLYLVYNYTAVEFSGLLKGSFLTSRFMIPLLPIVVMCAANLIKEYELFRKVFKVFVVLSLIVIPASQFIFHKMYASHEQAAKELEKTVKEKDIFVDLSGYTNIIRYFNPLTSEFDHISSIQNLKSKDFLVDNQLVILTRSRSSEEKSMRADSLINLVRHLPLSLTKSIEIDDQNWIEVYKRE